MIIEEYQEKFGSVNYPDGFEQLIMDRTIEEQLQFFRIGSGLYTHRSLEQRKHNHYDGAVFVEAEKDVKAVIVKDGKIAGVMVENAYGKVVPCMVEQRYCYYDEEEPDGSGYKQDVRYKYLICVPAYFDSNK